MENIIRKISLRWLGAWTRIEEPTRYCIGFLREEIEEEDRGRTEQTSLSLEISWERAEELAMDRVEWKIIMRYPMCSHAQDGLRSKV